MSCLVIKRALHYSFNWIRFLEINKLRNVITKKLTFSANPKLISIIEKFKHVQTFQVIESENEGILLGMKTKTQYNIQQISSIS